MILNRRVAVVLPAYNAAKTLERTYAKIPHDIVGDLILTDDASTDTTAAMARLACTSSSMSATVVMAATRRPATGGAGVDDRLGTI